MDVTLGLDKALQHTVHILSGLLLVEPLTLFGERLKSLQRPAGLIFIRDGDRHYVKLQEILYETPLPAHIKHLQKPLLGAVKAVFGAAAAVRDPNRTLAAGNPVADIRRQQLG